MDDPGLGLIERPALCFGAADQRCIAHSDLIAVQLRPDSSGRPSLVVVGMCRHHSRAGLAELRASWPFDPVETYSLDVAELVLAELLSGFAEDGINLLSDLGVA